MDIQQIKLISRAIDIIDDRLVINPIDSLSNDEYWIMIEKEYEHLKTVHSNTELIDKLRENSWKLDGLIISKDKAKVFINDNKLYPSDLADTENPKNYEITSIESAEEYAGLMNKYQSLKLSINKIKVEIENFLDKIYNPVSSVNNYFDENED